MLKSTILNGLGRYVLFLVLLIAYFNQSLAARLNDDADLDPISFHFSSNKSVVNIGEEFELTVTATLRPTWDPRLANTELDTDFRIKIIFPDGFVQTGGNYSDFIGGKIVNKTIASYKVKGKYVRQGKGEEFLLLRGTPQSVNLNKFLMRGQVTVLIARAEPDLSNNARVLNCSGYGHVDILNCDRLAGWAFDWNQPNTSVSVDIYDGTTLIAANVPASSFRQDLASAGYGNGNHSFSVATPSVLKDGQNHLVNVKISGCSYELLNSSKNLQCAGCSSPAIPTVSRTLGTTVCAASNQVVTLTANNDSGTVKWYLNGNEVGTGKNYQTSVPGSYTARVTVNNCTSLASSAINVSQTDGCGNTTVNCFGTGTAGRKRWTNIAGMTISELLRATNNLTASPSTNDQIQQLETEPNWGENYGQYIQGYITAPQAGTYTFWIASDDASEFWLSTDSNPINKVKRAFVNGWTGSREWAKEAGQKSVTVTLTACQQYYFEILHKDYDGGDYLAVGWAKPGQGTNSPSEIVPGSVLSPFSGGGTPPSCNFTISATNSNSNPQPGSSFNLITTCSGSDCSGVSYSWSGNDVNGTTQNLSNVKVPSSAGTYTYSVTASKAGCSSQTSRTSITVESAPSVCSVNMVKLKFRNSNECCMDRLVGASIQGSNNGGSSWTNIYTFSRSGNGQMTEYSFSNSTVYSSLRFQASPSGWGELRELEFYSGTTKLSGTPFGSAGSNATDGYDKAFDGDLETGWHGGTEGTANFAGLQNITCAGTVPVCPTPAAPSIAIMKGTTVCAPTNQQVTLTASNCSGSVTWYRDGQQLDSGVTHTTSRAGTYTAICSVNNCVSSASSGIVINQTSGCGNVTSSLLGSYTTIIGGREFTYNRTPEFEVQFNSDGTITDVTPGISYDGTTNKLGNRRIYYQIGYKIFENANETYNRLQNVYLPDGIYVLRQFICNENDYPNLTSFKTSLGGWPNPVTATNSKLSEIFLSVKTNGVTNLSIVPGWLKVNRNFIFPSVAQPKDLSTIDKFFGLVYQNRGSQASEYHALGVNTDLDYGNPAVQPNAWNTIRWPNHNASTMTNQALYDYGSHWIERSGNSRRFVLTDEIPENAQGQDLSIDSRMYHFYKGAYDRLAKFSGVTDKKQTGLYGSYGRDAGTINTDMLKNSTRSDFEKSLTTHVHKYHDPSTGQWLGDADYYASGQIDVRNLNITYYLKTGSHNVPYELIYANERIKIGTKTYQNKDRESNWIVFTWQKVEPEEGQRDANGIRNGIEYASSGELIPYANGTITSKDNLAIPALWDEHVNMAFWSTVIGKGIVLWNSPGARLGNNATMLEWWRADQPVYWTSTGGSQQNYVSQQNGAPQNNSNGLQPRLWASPGDAAYAGMEAAWNIRNRITTLSFASYNSSRGSFTASPGSTGLHLNGFGPLNNNLFVVRDAWDAKKGLAITGTGPGGSVVIYYNGFLSQHEYEDNVTVNGQNLGRVYGRQTVVKTF